MATLEKVTAFMTREKPTGLELLLFRHPSAGIQLPAGTVETGEAPEAAALREAGEESGLRGLQLIRLLGRREEDLVIGDHYFARATTVYSRPDSSSFDWARLRSGLTVRALRRVDGFVQMTFE
jgi:8-oxo-dGTP pyrophosphatase MutT (NUDIX family)